MKKISLILVLTFISIKSFAGSCPDGSEPTKSISEDGTYFVYKCGGGDGNAKESNSASKVSSNNSASSTQNSKIEIYDVEFSPGILDELLNLVISKTEYDFSAHRLSSNKDNYTCGFSLKRIIYENDPNGDIENWNMLTGKAHINGSDVSLSGSWRMGGLSSDSSYLEDEINLKLTENGHIVGKMAYFNLTVSDGEAPRNPLYVVLIEHQRSTPIKLSSRNRNETFDQYIDVEDWAGGFMQVYACKQV